jgi:FkbM family methyltransferase
MPPASPVATTISLLGFSLRAQGFRQRIALVLYYILFMADHVLRRKLNMTKWSLARPLAMDVTVAARWGRFHCRRGTSDGWMAGPMFERTTRSYLKQAIADGLFVDVGSHIGRYAVEMALHLGRNGRVIAIEPHPDTFKALKRNIDLNSLVNVVPVNIGCWSSDGVATLVGRDDTARISDELNDDRHLVRVTTLDDLLRNQLQLLQVAVLKIDVEGGEEQVLSGATKLIDGNPSLKIVFEALDESALTRIGEFLQPFGFRIERLSWKNFVAFRPQASIL